ncbi:hypothetical protein HAX54_028617 [Datura stramonium]|uniref:Endoplasmic reticulum metallopeptidase 1-like C-terminal domain-containing protein n=1 Tax=Datura stramonium TaxID=4076 RepID=A0ABS8V4F0_DATST|nr:hypothetical protein [Datura stramonium]
MLETVLNLYLGLNPKPAPSLVRHCGEQSGEVLAWMRCKCMQLHSKEDSPCANAVLSLMTAVLCINTRNKVSTVQNLIFIAGYFIPDVIVAALIGLVTSWSVGPILPVVSHWLSRPSILHFLLHSSVLSLAVSSQFFPYSADAPKRVIFQHTIRNAGASQIMETTYDFAVVDSNTLPFVFKHAPEVANTLHINTELSFDAVKQSHQEDWMGIFPISSLFSRCMKFPAEQSDVLAEYNHFPHLTTNKPQESLSGGSRRIYLEFSLGSLKEVWVAVLNITGSLSSWSFADNILPAPEKTGNGPPSYICRLSGAGDKNWIFWLEETVGTLSI